MIYSYFNAIQISFKRFSLCKLFAISVKLFDFAKDMKLERFVMTCCTEEQSNQQEEGGGNPVNDKNAPDAFLEKSSYKPFYVPLLHLLGRIFYQPVCMLKILGNINWILTRKQTFVDEYQFAKYKQKFKAYPVYRRQYRHKQKFNVYQIHFARSFYLFARAAKVSHVYKIKIFK